MRANGRKLDEHRLITIETNFLKNNPHSCLVSYGNTQVICAASIDEHVPFFLKKSNSGWVTAEYSMLPCSTHSRVTRDSSKGQINGRSSEIQRLIGRSLRSVVNLNLLGQRQITVDCDVLNADGGTRTASITGGYVALAMALKHLHNSKIITSSALKGQVCAISCGIKDSKCYLDIDYAEDSSIDIDANFVFNKDLDIIEIQATAENAALKQEDLFNMLSLAKKAAEDIARIQKKALSS